MTPELDELLRAAHAVREHAYAPYSKFLVGAAVRGDNGRVYAGVNVENASYGLTLCAERSAVAAAVSDGCRALTAVAVVTQSSPPAAPCGMCRQVLAELARPEVPVVMENLAGERVQTTLGELLPRAFAGDALK